MFNFFESNMLKSSFIAGVSKLKETIKTAEELKMPECVKCSLCCWIRPPWLTKEDVERISNYLKMTQEEFFKKYLVIDKPKRYAPLIIRKNEICKAGSFLPWRDSFNIETPCIFLENTKCSIQDVKPKLCIEADCSKPEIGKKGSQFKSEWTDKELEELGWDGVDFDTEDDY